MRGFRRQIGGWIDAGEGAEVVYEVGLIEIAAVLRDVGPIYGALALDTAQDFFGTVEYGSRLSA